MYRYQIRYLGRFRCFRGEVAGSAHATAAPVAAVRRRVAVTAEHPLCTPLPAAPPPSHSRLFLLRLSLSFDCFRLFLASVFCASSRYSPSLDSLRLSFSPPLFPPSFLHVFPRPLFPSNPATSPPSSPPPPSSPFFVLGYYFFVPKAPKETVLITGWRWRGFYLGFYLSLRFIEVGGAICTFSVFVFSFFLFIFLYIAHILNYVSPVSGVDYFIAV